MVSLWKIHCYIKQHYEIGQFIPKFDIFCIFSVEVWIVTAFVKITDYYGGCLGLIPMLDVIGGIVKSIWPHVAKLL